MSIPAGEQLEFFLWEEVFRAEARIARLGSQFRDRVVGTDVARTQVGRGSEAVDTTSLDNVGSD